MEKKLVDNIEIMPVLPKDGLIAFCNATYRDEIALNGIAIHTNLSRGGFRLVFPNKHLANGKMVQLFYPLDKEIMGELEDAIFGKYAELLDSIARD